MELLAGGRGIGYLLKSRVIDVDDFIDTLERVANGGSVWTPRWCRSWWPRVVVTIRSGAERARGRGLGADGGRPLNAGIARQLWITEGTVEKHVRSVLAKLSLPETDNDHRRVLAVLTFLEAR